MSDPRQVVHRLHPALADVLARTDGTPLGLALRDRVVEAGSTQALGVDVDRRAALTAHRWFLERASGDGMPLTAAGYLKPVDVRAAAAVLPAMHGWIHSMRTGLERRA
ncbi:hypothetical protein [Curtobacterium sp. ZW137]|uniref:hypothetical protein n=1 Tax=Curtobacterium sp. ZW137 TaxID=2485104 RepID=UPI000F4BFA3E|nr:hypothetical protein [Curtobacterium sp. ZW137]ROP65607.1 hypothetical protein EDF55_0044 [Curtobacterium sp. ZW137]